MIKILIADDQRLIRECLKKILESQSDFMVVGCASNGKEALKLCEDLNPNVVLMDIRMPVCDGIEATHQIKTRFPLIKVLMLTASEHSKDVENALVSGADGYVLKDIGTEELIISIRSALLGFEIIQKGIFNRISTQVNEKKITSITKINGMDVMLSERELKIIQMIIDGYTNKDISSELYIAEGTVKNAMTEIITKLQLKDRTQLAVFAIRNKLV